MIDMIIFDLRSSISRKTQKANMKQKIIFKTNENVKVTQKKTQ